jgi:hypothetical protein
MDRTKFVSEKFGDTWMVEKKCLMGRYVGQAKIIEITPIDSPRELQDGETLVATK